jgi:hypothetical protein
MRPLPGETTRFTHICALNDHLRSQYHNTVSESTPEGAQAQDTPATTDTMHTRPKRTITLPARYHDAMSEADFQRSANIVNALLAEETYDMDDPQVFLAREDWDSMEPDVLLTEIVPWFEAMKPETRGRFQDAINEELKSLLEKDVYDEVSELPPRTQKRRLQVGACNQT